MEVFRVRSDGAEELLASGLSPADSQELRDWLRYTKPMDHGTKILAKGAPEGDSAFSVAGSSAHGDAD